MPRSAIPVELQKQYFPVTIFLAEYASEKDMGQLAVPPSSTTNPSGPWRWEDYGERRCCVQRVARCNGTCDVTTPKSLWPLGRVWPPSTMAVCAGLQSLRICLALTPPYRRRHRLHAHQEFFFYLPISHNGCKMAKWEGVRVGENRRVAESPLAWSLEQFINSCLGNGRLQKAARTGRKTWRDIGSACHGRTCG